MPVRMGRYKDALNSFYNVVLSYPLSPKLTASTLKLGQTYTKLGDQENARIMLIVSSLSTRTVLKLRSPGKPSR